MASIRELWRGRSGNWGIQSQTYTRVWQVIEDDKDRTPAEVLLRVKNSLGGNYRHPVDGNAYLESLEASNVDEHRRIWIVTGTYTANARKYDFDDPTQSDPIVTWSFNKQSYKLEEDANGTIIKNSAGDPYPEPIYGEKLTLLLRIERFESSNPANNILRFVNTVNNASITIAGLSVRKGNARMNSIVGSKEQFRNQDYWRVEYEIEIDQSYSGSETDNWKVSKLDVGYYYLSGGSRIRAVDSKGEPTVEPVKLDGSGGYDPNNPIEYSFEYTIYREEDWSVLNLPTGA